MFIEPLPLGFCTGQNSFALLPRYDAAHQARIWGQITPLSGLIFSSSCDYSRQQGSKETLGDFIHFKTLKKQSRAYAFTFRKISVSV